MVKEKRSQMAGVHRTDPDRKMGRKQRTGGPSPAPGLGSVPAVSSVPLSLS